VNDADPDAPVESFAVTVTFEVPALVGVPEIRPDELIDNPAGKPDAEYVKVCPAAESVACTCSPLIAVPTVPLWLPGLVTVTVLPLPPLIVQVNDADPDAPVVSVAVTVTL
jgi:hypothetical protein